MYMDKYCTHTHTRSLSLSLSLSHTHTLSLSLTKNLTTRDGPRPRTRRYESHRDTPQPSPSAEMVLHTARPRLFQRKTTRHTLSSAPDIFRILKNDARHDSHCTRHNHTHTHTHTQETSHLLPSPPRHRPFLRATAPHKHN